MELFQEILLSRLAQEKVEVTFPGLTLDVNAIVENTCYQALYRIKAIIEDDSLEGPECFYKIEEIICVLEELGISTGIRHDFG